MPVLAEMGALGIGFLKPAALAASEGIQARMLDLEREAHALAGQEFSITSPLEVSNVRLSLLCPSCVHVLQA